MFISMKAPSGFDSSNSIGKVSSVAKCIVTLICSLVDQSISLEERYFVLRYNVRGSEDCMVIHYL